MNAEISTVGVPSTKMNAKSRPSIRPFNAPERAAVAYPSRPVIRSMERSPLPTIAMSRAGTSPAMSEDTAF